MCVHVRVGVASRDIHMWVWLKLTIQFSNAHAVVV